MKFIDIRIFLLSLTFGIIAIYLLGPQNKEIYIYPTPDNIEKYLWKDNAGTCYKWDVKEVSEKNKSKLIPAQY